jgi:hypothetical protein
VRTLREQLEEEGGELVVNDPLDTSEELGEISDPSQ